MGSVETFPLARRLRRVLTESRDGARVRPHILASVFVTFEFSPTAFGDYILPALHGIIGPADRPHRMALLQAQLHEEGLPLVFFDDGVELDERTAAFRYDQVPVHVPGGCLHAKHVLLLLADQSRRTDAARLVVLTTSANLTAAGWRQNVELADIQTIVPNDPRPIRADLVRLTNRLAGWASEAGADPDHLRSLSRIRDFLGSPSPVSAGLPRIWDGTADQGDLVHFLEEQVAALQLGPVVRLTAGAPYVSNHAGPLERLRDTFHPEVFDVLQPTDEHGATIVSEQWEKRVRALGATLRPLRALPGSDDHTRFLHAKFLHLEFRGAGLLVMGSPNLSEMAFARFPGVKSNFETALLRSAPADLALLDRQEEAPEVVAARNVTEPPEERDAHRAGVRLTFDWAKPDGQRTGVLPVRAGMLKGVSEIRLRIERDSEPVVAELFQDTDTGSWSIPHAADAFVQRALDHTSMLWVDAGNGAHQVPVVELHQLFAPPRTEVLLDRDGLLRYWILQAMGDRKRSERQADLLDKALLDNQEQSGSLTDSSHVGTPLDAPIAVIQAFASLQQLCRRASARNDLLELEARLLSPSSGSLLAFLDREARLADDVDHRSRPAEVVARVVGCLCARELLEEARNWGMDPQRLTDAEAHLGRLLNLTWPLVDPADELGDFRDWVLQEWRWAP